MNNGQTEQVALSDSSLPSLSELAPLSASVSFGRMTETCAHIIHAVVPDGLYAHSGGNDAHIQQLSSSGLRQSFASVIARAEDVGARSLAIPALGCGVNGWRPAVAARAAAQALSEVAGARSVSGDGPNGAEGGAGAMGSVARSGLPGTPPEGVVRRVDLVMGSSGMEGVWRAVLEKHLGQPDQDEGEGGGAAWVLLRRGAQCAGRSRSASGPCAF